MIKLNFKWTGREDEMKSPPPKIHFEKTDNWVDPPELGMRRRRHQRWKDTEAERWRWSNPETGMEDTALQLLKNNKNIKATAIPINIVGTNKFPPKVLTEQINWENQN